MNAETLTVIQVMIERLGLPVFVSLCALVFLYLIFKYFTKVTEKKDAEFVEFVNRSNERVDDLVSEHNSTVKSIADGFSATVSELKGSIDALRDTLISRTKHVDQQTQILKNIAEEHSAKSDNN